MFDKIKLVSNRFKILLLALFTLALGSGQAWAALTLDQQAVVDGINTLISDMTTVAWAMILSVTGTFIGIKVFKKFIGKASS